MVTRSSPPLVDIANYVADYYISSSEAYETARYCLMDTLGCGLLALRFPECTKHLGPIVEGTVVPFGARVPGTSYRLDPVKAAFDLDDDEQTHVRVGVRLRPGVPGEGELARDQKAHRPERVRRPDAADLLLGVEGVVEGGSQLALLLLDHELLGSPVAPVIARLHDLPAAAGAATSGMSITMTATT